MINRVFSITKKDIIQIFRNKFMAAITFLVIFLYAVIYYVLPSKVDETFKMGFYLEKGRSALEEELSEDEGLEVKWVKNIKELEKLVKDRDVEAGFSITFPENKPDVRFYVSSRTPDEIREAGEVIGREIAYNMLGPEYKLPIEFEEIVIGPDMLGNQIPLRNKLRIFFILSVFLVELYALANLLSDEIRLKTVNALLVTPVNIKEFLSAKALTGITMAFSEALLVSLLIKILKPDNFFAVILFILLCSIMVTAVAFFVGSISRGGMMLIVGWGMLAMLTLMIPAIPLIYPGASTDWIKYIPTYHFVTPLDGMLNYGFPLSDYYAQASYLLLYGLAFFVISFFFLRRKLS